MQIDIYDMKNSPEGKRQGDEYLALVELCEEGVRIETYDGKLKEKLEEIFSAQLPVRVSDGNNNSILTHHYEIIQPFTEEFFEEILLSLFRYNLFGVIRK